MLTSERVEPPRSVSWRIEPPTLVPGEVEPPVADDFDSSRRVSPPLARAPCCTRVSAGGRRCVCPGMRAPGACIPGFEGCACLGCCTHLDRLFACEAPSLEHFGTFGC